MQKEMIADRVYVFGCENVLFTVGNYILMENISTDCELATPTYIDDLLSENKTSVYVT